MVFNKITIEKIIKVNILFLFIVLPLWSVISIQLGAVIFNKEFFSALKYLFIIFLLLFTFISISIRKKKIHIYKGYIFFLLFTIYVFLHLIGYVPMALLIDGMRYELLFMIMAVLLLFTSINSLPSINTISKIIILQGVTVVIFGFWQIYDITILESIYRSEIDDIGNIKLAISYRVVSLLNNPINLGAFLIVAYLFSIYKKDSLSIFFYIFFMLLLILIFGSLSRLALLSFFLVVLVNFIINNKLINNLFFILIIMLVLSTAIYSLYDEYGYFLVRFENLSSLSEYTENARLTNWINAIENMNTIQLWWGYGLGMSTPTFEKILLYGGIMIENSFISIFIQYGVMGLVGYILIFIRFFFISVSLRKYDKKLFQFMILFLVFFSSMSIGNDFFKNSPFVFYFWFFYIYAERIYINYTKERKFFKG